MKTSTKIIAVTSIGILLALLIPVILYLSLSHNNKEAEAEADQPKELFIEDDYSSDPTEEIEGVDKNVFITEESSDDSFLETMHKMTHQKVIASDKWGAIQMTPESIDLVLEAAKKKTWTSPSIGKEMISMLERWKNNDFSKIDEDHNLIWSFQGGTVGYATGIMDKEHEDLFIMNNFK